ncbi:MAG TPA: M4 family metallopeptidase [Polyangiaceae bacterium]|nr:M4 family metallopeptidase [Polyangiaceae bacterium]
MARIRHWKGSSLLAALAPAAAACAGGCADDAPPEKPDAPGADAAAGGASDAAARAPGVVASGRGEARAPGLVRGDFGRLRAGAALPSLAPIAPLYDLSPADLRLDRVRDDALGYRHFKYRQQIDGEAVVGSELVVHADPKGLVYAAQGNARPGRAVPDALVRRPPDGLGPRYAGAVRSAPELVYVLSSRDGRVYRAWSLVAEGTREGDPYKDRVFVDALTGQIVDVRPMIHTAVNRQVYSADHSIWLPGTLQRGEGQGPAGDGVVNANYDHLGKVYACYQQLFGRDSYDGAGAALTSSVHYVQNYVNAFWNGTQMVYGDGDGVQSGSLALSFDVTAHELTHAVTEHESNLVYQDEPGAINEAMSDVFGAVCEAFADGAVTADTWKVGEDVWTPGVAGDALRYLNNPTLDGYSTDFYPERLLGFEDYGGVHANSGIANHAFYLLAVGGKHVRNKTPDVTVPALGLEKAGQIWYRANTQYLTVSSGFASLRAALKQAATDLYGADAGTATDRSMDAVGAPGGAPPPPPSTVTLANGQPLGGQAASQGASLYYAIDLPSGASNIRVTTTGGSGDADLYGKIGSPPAGQTDCAWKSETTTTAETITVPNGTTGKLYLQLLAYAAYSNVTIKAEYGTSSSPPPSPNALKNGVPATGLAGASGSKTYFTFDVPSGASNLRFRTSGGSPDADLYVKFGAEPGTSSYDFRSASGTNTETVAPASAKAGRYYVMVHGYTSYSGVSLTASYSL